MPGLVERFRKVIQGERSDARADATVLDPSLPPTLSSPEAQASLRDEGFVVLDLLDPTETASLLDLCRSLHPAPQVDWECDFYSDSPELKAQVHREVGATFRRGIDEHFVDHSSILHNFVLNWPGVAGGLDLHQHTSIVDERRFRSAVIWCALNDSTEENGTLHVVPRSHLIQQGPKAEREAGWFEPHEDEILRNHLTAVPLRAGEALVFDNQLLHCSFPNSSDGPRITAVAIVTPRTAEPRYFERSDDEVRMHRLEPTFFLERTAGDMEWARPDGLELLRVDVARPTEVTAEELRGLLSPGTCTHATAGPA